MISLTYDVCGEPGVESKELPHLSTVIFMGEVKEVAYSNADWLWAMTGEVMLGWREIKKI